MATRIPLYCLLLLIYCSPTMAARLLAVEIKQQDGSPAILFSLDKPVAHKVFTLTDPNRVVIDFEKTNLAINLQRINIDKRFIKYLRSGYPSKDVLRLVFEVNQAVITKTTPVSSSVAKHSFSVAFSTLGHVVSSSKKEISSTANKPKSASPVTPSPTVPKKLRDVVIVLDPGHGGKDPGATGPRRTAEKNITLTIAHKLKQIIDRQQGMRAVLTRKGDYYISLRERLTIARKYGADVFISIHADAFISHQSHGASVFALSQSGATSEAARWLAEKENYSELGGVNLADLDDENGLVRTVLIDLSQTATIGASLHMGERVLHNLDKITNLHHSKVEQARFMVLKSPDIPSILIETGFITNPWEERNLTSSRYQTQLTQAIFQGLKRYFWDYPPHGTVVENLVGNNMYLVRNNESLPQIARKYHLTVAALQAANCLNSNRVKAGEKLIIPVAVS